MRNWKAAVYKHIPEYFPNEVGVVGGMVGLIGGLGGFIGPILFGYLLDFSGLWTSSWIFVFIVSAISLFWMNTIIKKMMHSKLLISKIKLSMRTTTKTKL
ncbi:hypothetical protein [Chryseobacterium indoltheticum]|uniref:hypothetical protein n=1 Tax=Chryseobacterium indoltheticum TaxID=254 RepID=UPI003F498F6C